MYAVSKAQGLYSGQRLGLGTQLYQSPGYTSTSAATPPAPEQADRQQKICVHSPDRVNMNASYQRLGKVQQSQEPLEASTLHWAQWTRGGAGQVCKEPEELGADAVLLSTSPRLPGRGSIAGPTPACSCRQCQSCVPRPAAVCRAEPEGHGAGLLMQESKEEGRGQSKTWERTWEIWERKYKMGCKCLFSINISHPGRTLVF